ncbi:2Fe-2S iron-sulfur cluster-binding protein [Thalassotalea ganghwensis]
MAHKFAQIAFTDSVKNVQTEENSRQGYASWESGDDVNYLLSQREAQFISQRDTFYMASVSETNWPYVQHRGGPKGFLKVIDANTIGFADYRGNRQYVSTGNFRKNNRVALILMDYPNKTRLKILGQIKEISVEDIDLIAKLESHNNRAPIERGFIINIEAFDWNCPKYITPRFTEEELSSILRPIMEENQRLQALHENRENQTNNATSAIGKGELPLVITGIRQLSTRVRAFELRHTNNQELPEVSPGAHLQVPIKLTNGEVITRHYSICSNPARRDIYEIAVQKEAQGQGGSKALHESFSLGTQINCASPDNYFSLASTESKVSESILIAAGIGITPIKPMAQHLFNKGQPFSMHYTGKSIQEMPYAERLLRTFPEQLKLYQKDLAQRLNLSHIIENALPETHFYLCGPNRLIEEFLKIAKQKGISDKYIHFEKFNVEPQTNAQPVTLELAKRQEKINVSADETLLDALIKADVKIPYSCKVGDCKTCAIEVLEGDAEHHDNALSEQERTSGKLFCPCVSRAKNGYLKLNL